jgi:mannose-1-phosphate guanylyltransferase
VPSRKLRRDEDEGIPSLIMRAMILAAGLGTRLRPLTLVRPKVLVPVMGITILDFWVSRLHKAGFESVVLNAFHLHEKLMAAAKARRWPIPVHVQIEREILGTGGGIRRVLDFFDQEPFVVINGDIVSDAPLEQLLREHIESQEPVSLLLHDFPEFNNVAVRRDGVVLDFGKSASGLAEDSDEVDLMAFTGIHFIDPRVLVDIPPNSFSDIISVYRQISGNGRPLHALSSPHLFWREMGSLRSYFKIHRELSRMPVNFLEPIPTGEAILIDPEARVEANVSMKGFVVVGKGSHVMEGAEIENTILWENVRVNRDSFLRDCIVADGVHIEGVHEGETLAGLCDEG